MPRGSRPDGVSRGIRSGVGSARSSRAVPHSPRRRRRRRALPSAVRLSAARPPPLLRARPGRLPCRGTLRAATKVRIASNLYSPGKHTKSAPVVAENTLLLCNVGRGWEGAPSTAPDFLYPTSLRLAASRPFPKRIGQLTPLIVFRLVSSTRFSDGPFSSLFSFSLSFSLRLCAASRRALNISWSCDIPRLPPGQARAASRHRSRAGRRRVKHQNFQITRC